MASYLLLETGDKLILEDGSGFLLLEIGTVTGTGILVAGSASLDGAGNVTGGTVTVSDRARRIYLDYEAVTHRG